MKGMKKKRISFIQVGFDFDGSVYLPCAAGAIAAYSLSMPGLRERYEFTEIIFRREKLENAEKKIVDPYIAAFSCSVWNMEYNKALAKRVKRRYPGCTIVFGGHSVSENGGLLETEPYIDVLMFGEGEEPFAELLERLPENRLSEVPNIAYRENNGIVATPRKYYNDISNYPSPYLSGMFDSIIKENPMTDFLAVLETNRGCPYSCAYCDWCAGKKVRLFPMEKVLGEIEWLAEHKIEYCFCADSNFGMFERDLDIAKALVASKRKTGYPKVFRPCYEKNSDDRVFEICKILNTQGMDKGATMAYQTLCPQALENTGRKNLTIEHFSSLIEKYNEAGIPAYSELILGLPGETRQSFCEGICRLLESGQHNALSVYHCELLPNAYMSEREYMEKHGIEVIKVAFNHIHSAINRDEQVQEYSYLVRSTNTLSRDDWVYANLFSVCVQCFHSLGLLRYFAIYLYTQKQMGYFDFYIGLLRFILERSDGRLHGMWCEFRRKYESSLAGDWNYHSEKLGNVTWFFEEGAFLEIVSNYDSLMGELAPFLEGFNLDERLFRQLSAYQRAVIKKPFSKGGVSEFEYDFYTYFENAIAGKPTPLRKQRIAVCFNQSVCYDSLPDFAREIVWFGRRRGATVYHSNEMTVQTI